MGQVYSIIGKDTSVRAFGPVFRLIDTQRGHLFAWLPVCLSLGIGAYFALPFEPDARIYASALAVVFGAGAALIALRNHEFGEQCAPLLIGLMTIALGLLLAGYRAHAVNAPVMGFRYYGPVEGRIIKIDRSGSDKIRLLLDQVRLERTGPDRTPARVRVSLHGTQGFFTPEPGARIALTAHLGPPEGPVEPGGFDFERMAWFDRLGGVGYTRAPALLLAPSQGGRSLWIARLRADFSAAIQAKMPGEEGAFAAAILTGDRSGMSAETQENLRASNLAHLLAISGLHMGLLTGLVFSALNFIFVFIPARYASNVPGRKLAAVGALMAGAFYLALSGGNVATERAFIMVAVMFTAVILGRRALTLRAVALAALIVLTLRPEVLTEPGFQMSFAATVALVAVFGEIRVNSWRFGPRWMAPIATVVISSLVAGLATAPVAAAHFNRIADYGLIANLVSVPLMGLIVMPAALGAIILAPLGLSALGFAIMRPAIAWILGVAEWISSLEGALSFVPSPPALAMPLIAFGGIWLVLWQGKWLRMAGVSGLVAGFVLWAGADRPMVLISPDGGLVGLMTEQGRALSKPKGSGFAAREWLQNDGDGADQTRAATRGGFDGEKGHILFGVGVARFAHLSGRGARERVAQSCASAGHVFLSAKYEGARPKGCDLYDQVRLRETGSVAIYLEEGGAKIVTARDFSGARLWNSKPMRASLNRGLLAMLGG